MNYEEITTSFHEAETILNSLCFEDCFFRIGSCIQTIEPKKIIKTAIKTKQIDGDTIYKVKLPDLYNKFHFFILEKFNYEKNIEINKDKFLRFQEEYEDFDEIEIRSFYITAEIANEDIKNRFLNTVCLFADSKDYIKISSRMNIIYGLAKWNIPFMSEDAESFSESAKDFVFKQLKEIINCDLFYAYTNILNNGR